MSYIAIRFQLASVGTVALRHFAIAVCGVFLLAPVYAADHPLLSADELAWLREHPAPIRVHNEMDWRPFNFNEDGEPKGYSIEYMNLVAKKLGLKVEYISGPTWNTFLEMMRDGSLDLMVNIASTKERRTYLGFTEPYFIISTAIYVRNSEQNISDLGDLAGRKIGFTEGFFFGEFFRKYYPEVEIVTFDSTLDSFVAVDQGIVDAALELPIVAQEILLEAKLNTLKLGGMISDPRLITTFYIATRKDASILRGIIQKGMDAVTAAEELSIRQKWKIEEPKQSLISTDEEAYLKQLGALNICVNPHHLPLEAVNHDGKLIGVSSEFVSLLSERLKIPLNIQKTRSWNETLELSQQGKCDLLPMIAKTNKRQDYLNFTSPWLSTPIVVATRQDQIFISNMDQIIGRKIGVVRGLATKDILHSVYPKFKLIEVESVSDGLDMVSSGALFGLVDTIPVISRTLQTGAITGVKISGDLGLSMDYAIGVKVGEDQLLNIMQRITNSIEHDQIDNIYNRWLAVAYIDRFDYTRLWQVMGGGFIIIFYLLYRYRRGRKITQEIREAHAEVEEVNLELKAQARTDALTKIANRLKIDEKLRHEFGRYERNKEPFSVILLDVDHFKQINDRHGHHVGDEVLLLIANTIKQHTRAIDVPGRWGGEEFLVICPSTALDGAIKLAEILRSSIMDCTTDNLPFVTASFGVATVQGCGSVLDLVRSADQALYQAKGNGRNRVEASPPSTS